MRDCKGLSLREKSRQLKSQFSWPVLLRSTALNREAEGSEAAIERVRPQVLELCGRYPVYGP